LPDGAGDAEVPGLGAVAGDVSDAINGLVRLLFIGIWVSSVDKNVMSNVGGQDGGK
jgi:hypothetical protein